MEEGRVFSTKGTQGVCLVISSPTLWIAIYSTDSLHVELLHVATSEDTVEVGLGTGKLPSIDLFLYSSNIMPQDSEYSRFFQIIGLKKIIQ